MSAVGARVKHNLCCTARTGCESWQFVVLHVPVKPKAGALQANVRVGPSGGAGMVADSVTAEASPEVVKIPPFTGGINDKSQVQLFTDQAVGHHLRCEDGGWRVASMVSVAGFKPFQQLVQV